MGEKEFERWLLPQDVRIENESHDSNVRIRINFPGSPTYWTPTITAELNFGHLIEIKGHGHIVHKISAEECSPKIGQLDHLAFYMLLIAKLCDRKTVPTVEQRNLVLDNITSQEHEREWRRTHWFEQERRNDEIKLGVAPILRILYDSFLDESLVYVRKIYDFYASQQSRCGRLRTGGAP